jgi:hypothetical protein
MTETASCYIVCPNCDAMIRNSRRSCYQCGENLIQAEPAIPESGKKGWSAYTGFIPDEVRGAPRIPVTIEGNTVLASGEIGEPVSIEDIGKGGLQFRSASAYSEGHKVRLVIPVDGEPQVATGIVRRVTRALTSERSFICGVEFLHADQGLLDHISILDNRSVAR